MISEPDSAAKWRLLHGIEFPTVTYQGFSLSSWSMINGVFSDICDRRGIKQAFVDDEPSREMVTALLAAIRGAETETGEDRWMGLAKKFKRVIANHNSKFDNELDGIDIDIQEEMLAEWADVLRVGKTFQPEQLCLEYILQNQFSSLMEQGLDQFEGMSSYDIAACGWVIKGQKSILEIIEKHYTLIPKTDDNKTDIAPGITRLGKP